MFHFSSLRVSFSAVLLHNKRMTSGASLGLIPRNSAAGSFIRDLRNFILFLKTMSLIDKVRLSSGSCCKGIQRSGCFLTLRVSFSLLCCTINKWKTKRVSGWYSASISAYIQFPDDLLFLFERQKHLFANHLAYRNKQRSAVSQFATEYLSYALHNKKYRIGTHSDGSIFSVLQSFIFKMLIPDAAIRNPPTMLSSFTNSVEKNEADKYKATK